MKEQQKQKALELMQQLDIYKPYIKGFRDNDMVCFFEEFGGFWVYQEPEIEAKMKEVEKEYNCIVYAITHEYTTIGEMYDFLMVTEYPEEWDTLVISRKNNHHAFAYVWNKTCDWGSELGTVTVESFGGGIRRIA